MNNMVRNDEVNRENQVECRYNGTVTMIPKKLFLQMVMRVQQKSEKYVRYKDGAVMYAMSERQFYKLAHDAGAVLKWGRTVLVDVNAVDKFLNYFRQDS